MKVGLSTAALAALLIAGCDQPGNGVGNGTKGAASAPIDNRTAPPPAAGNTSGGNVTDGPAASAMPLTREYVAGRWTITGNCTAPEFVFNADGTVSRGGRNFQWRVDGNNLVVTREGGGEPESTPVRVIDQTHMTVTVDEGPLPLTRC